MHPWYPLLFFFDFLSFQKCFKSSTSPFFSERLIKISNSIYKQHHNCTMNFAAEQQQADPSRELYKLYQRFCAFGKGHRLTAQQLSMDSRTFQKFNKDAGLISKKLTKTSVDLIFTKVKAKGQRTVDFNGFVECLRHVSVVRQVSFDALITYILRSGVGPTTNAATRAESNRFHDDVSSYTGVYKAGGPTTIGNGGDGAVITLSNLADRSAYDIRGRKIEKPSPTRGKQRRLSAKGQQMLNSAMGGGFSADAQEPMPSYAQNNYAQQQQMQQQRQMQQQQQIQQQRLLQQQRQQYAAPQQPFRTTTPQSSSPSKKKGGGNIFDRLTDTSQYTGAHKHRFDADGRGRGLAGRDRIATGRGYIGSSPSANGGKVYKGSTNTGTNEVFHDSSQFLMRR
jgi:hypothetical protein